MRLAISKVQSLASPFPATPPAPAKAGLCHLICLNLTFLLCTMCVTTLRLGPLGRVDSSCLAQGPA